MDETFLQLAELIRAGWTIQISPEPGEVPQQGVIVWSRGSDALPSIVWVNLWAPETDLRIAIAKKHANVFPDSPFGDIPPRER